MNRNHVHLSVDKEVTKSVANRRGKEVILKIDSRMFKDGFSFFLSENNVWLTDNVPCEY